MSDRVYEEVKYHTRQKHAFLEEYLRIWTERVGRNKGTNAPTLALMDLFAGSGWCHNADRDEEWAGTGTLLAQCLSQYPSRRPTTLFLNAYASDREKAKKQLASLRQTVSEIPLPPTTNVVYEQKPVGEALITAESSFDPDFPSLWVLDPYGASDLPWSIVERISRLEGKNYKRRPELFINLMTFDLQENMNVHPHVVSTAMGMDEDEWRPRVNELMESDRNARSAFVELYAERLHGLYGRPPYAVEVDGVHGNIVYVLFFCSDHDAGFHMMRHEALPQFTKWRTREWERAAKSIAATKRTDRKADEAGHRQEKLDSGN